MAQNILIVDDDSATRIAISELLEEMGQPHIAVDSGPRCLALLVSNPDDYSMVLMDIHMPVLSGLETVSWLRSSEMAKLRELPVYALTADVTYCDAHKLSRHALSGVLRKPVTRGDLEQIMVLDNV